MHILNILRIKLLLKKIKILKEVYNNSEKKKKNDKNFKSNFKQKATIKKNL